MIDPFTTAMIASLVGGMASGGMSSILGNNQKPNMTSSGIQPNQQFKSPFTMPDVYNRQQQPIQGQDPRNSILGTTDSIAKSLGMRYRPSTYFGQYL